MTGLMGLIPDLGGAGPLPKLGPMMGLVGPITDLGAHVRPEGAHTKRERARRRAFGPPLGLRGPRDGGGPSARLRPWGPRISYGGGARARVPPPLVCATAWRQAKDSVKNVRDARSTT